MRVRNPMVVLAFLLPAPLLAQSAPTKDQLVGTWVNVVDGKAQDKDLQGKVRENYLTLYASGVYSVQAKSKEPRLLGIGIAGKRDSVTDAIAGESQRLWSRWALAGDSIKLGQEGLYNKYQVVLQGPELALQYLTWYSGDNKHHLKCKMVYTRVDAAQPLPAPQPTAESCDTLAGPLPRPTPKAADLIGTWISAVGEPFGLSGDAHYALFCPDPDLKNQCIIQTDTMTFQADSTIVHNFVRTTWKGMNRNDSTVAKADVTLGWWIASDTLWTKPMADPKRGPIATKVSFEDNGQYLFYKDRLYRRATARKP